MKKKDFSNIKEGTLIKVLYGRKEKSGYYFKTKGFWKLLGNFELRENMKNNFLDGNIFYFSKVKSFEILKDMKAQEEIIEAKAGDGMSLSSEVAQDSKEIENKEEKDE